MEIPSGGCSYQNKEERNKCGVRAEVGVYAVVPCLVQPVTTELLESLVTVIVLF